MNRNLSRILVSIQYTFNISEFLSWERCESSMIIWMIWRSSCSRYVSELFVAHDPGWGSWDTSFLEG